MDVRRTRVPSAHPEYHHRNIQGGTARAAVFGVSDGLVSNMGLILGVAGADPAPAVVRLAGLAGLVAGAISMAAGEYNSMKVQAELLQRELAIEERELRRRPEHETAELAGIYEDRGLDPRRAREMAEAMMSDPDTALETHAREELGINPAELGSPWGAGISSFFAFSAGAIVPLVPWFVAEGTAATLASLILGVLAAVVVGVLIARSTGRPTPRAVVRQVLFTIVPAAITFAIGRALGVGGVS
ncbi:MAG TPA: VIT1/CCC1 transporter family protein [Acidimicrobiales bacterium]|nr:VIT1/CCC1 transporter family protein [Acidimicrobiales bacterium]